MLAVSASWQKVFPRGAACRGRTSCPGRLPALPADLHHRVSQAKMMGGRGVVFLHIQCKTGEDLGLDLVQERGELVSHQVRVGHGS